VKIPACDHDMENYNICQGKPGHFEINSLVRSIRTDFIGKDHVSLATGLFPWKKLSKIIPDGISKGMEWKGKCRTCKLR
jgi:hypothetical protein